MGQVHRATDTKPNRQVALEIVPATRIALGRRVHQGDTGAADDQLHGLRLVNPRRCPQ